MPRKSDPTKPKKVRKFSDIFSKYKTYNPDTDGFGSQNQWKQAFNQRMGKEEASHVISSQSNSTWTILGLPEKPKTIDELKKAYRKVIMQHASCFEVNATEQQQNEAKELIAAYTILSDQLE